MVTALKQRLSYIGVQVGDAHDTAVEYAASLHGLRKLTDKEAVCYVGWTEVPLPMLPRPSVPSSGMFTSSSTGDTCASHDNDRCECGKILHNHYMSYCDSRSGHSRPATFSGRDNTSACFICGQPWGKHHGWFCNEKDWIDWYKKSKPF